MRQSGVPVPVPEPAQEELRETERGAGHTIQHDHHRMLSTILDSHETIMTISYKLYYTVIYYSRNVASNRRSKPWDSAP